MNHFGTRPIKTERLLLRPLTLDDAEVMFEHWAGDPEVTRFLRWEPHKNWMVTFAYLNELVPQYTREDFYCWGITDGATGVLMGTISIAPAEPDPQWAGLGLDTGEPWEVGYCIGKRWWNKGYTTEALRGVVEYWFDNTDAGWISAGHALQNPASGKVLQKAGFWFDHEAVYHTFLGVPVPCNAYCLTREDYAHPELFANADPEELF